MGFLKRNSPPLADKRRNKPKFRMSKARNKNVGNSAVVDHRRGVADGRNVPRAAGCEAGDDHATARDTRIGDAEVQQRRLGWWDKLTQPRETPSPFPSWRSAISMARSVRFVTTQRMAPFGWAGSNSGTEIDNWTQTAGCGADGGDWSLDSAAATRGARTRKPTSPERRPTADPSISLENLSAWSPLPFGSRTI